jgi:hypothetical protein
LARRSEVAKPSAPLLKRRHLNVPGNQLKRAALTKVQQQKFVKIAFPQNGEKNFGSMVFRLSKVCYTVQCCLDVSLNYKSVCKQNAFFST